MQRLLILALLLTLAGCGVAERRAAQAQALDAQIRARCTEYGFKPETDAHAQCVQQEYLATRAAARRVQQDPGPERRTSTCREVFGRYECTTD